MCRIGSSRAVAAHDNAVRTRRFSAWGHFLAMGFAQITFRESLRDIEACLYEQPALRHHLGFCSRVTRSTLARVNEKRPWQLFAAVAQKLIVRAQNAYAKNPTCSISTHRCMRLIRLSST